jgi:phosphate transport system substrate-binding protein
VITNPSVTVKNLTRKQIQDIFSGKLENWKQVGGPDQRIVLVNRTHGSGTRVVFERTLLAPAVGSDTGLTEDATGAAVAVVKQTPGAISYAAFSGTHRGGVNEVSIDGVAPTDANVITGKYPFWSYEHMFTAGPAAGEAKKFIDFISSNGELIHRNGFIKVSDMKVKGRLFRHHGLPDCC